MRLIVFLIALGFSLSGKSQDTIRSSYEIGVSFYSYTTIFNNGTGNEKKFHPQGFNGIFIKIPAKKKILRVGLNNNFRRILKDARFSTPRDTFDILGTYTETQVYLGIQKILSGTSRYQIYYGADLAFVIGAFRSLAYSRLSKVVEPQETDLQGIGFIPFLGVAYSVGPFKLFAESSAMALFFDEKSFRGLSGSYSLGGVLDFESRINPVSSLGLSYIF